MQLFDLETPVLLSFPGWGTPLGIVLWALFGMAGWGLFIWLALSRRVIRVKLEKQAASGWMVGWDEPEEAVPMEIPAMASFGAGEDWLFRFRSTVDRRLHEFDLKAEDIARELGMSRTYFFRQVKQETGKTPSQYLQDARFERARHLLETGEVDSVKAAAISVGFRNGKYFSRVFRERFGKWPSEYLRRSGGRESQTPNVRQ